MYRWSDRHLIRNFTKFSLKTPIFRKNLNLLQKSSDFIPIYSIYFPQYSHSIALEESEPVYIDSTQ